MARSIHELPTIGPAAITLGVFDGVHLGHRRLVEVTAGVARRHDTASVVLAFDPHPEEVLVPGTRVPRLLPPEVTLARLREAGADHALHVRFDDHLRSLSPEEFLAALEPAMKVRAITMTPSSAFGKGRSGTLERVTAVGRERGFECVPVEPVTVDGEVVSSSRVRALVAAGEIEAASRLLAGWPVLRGRVVHGDQRGRELGFPTANLAFDYVPQLPALGIYLGRVSVPERGVGPGHPALVSVGVRPTFHDDGRVLVEVYLLDWEGDLYDAQLGVELRARLREERRFDSVEALVRQMRADEEDARHRIGADGG